MKLQATKTPLLIAAIATAVTITSLSPAAAGTVWLGATTADVEQTQVVDANFKAKFKKHKFHSHKFHGVKKKKYVSPKSKFIAKKKFKKFF